MSGNQFDEDYEGPSFTGSFEIIEEREASMKIWDGTGRAAWKAQWIPKSQVVRVEKTAHKDIVEITMKEWIAKEKGFI